MCAQENIHAHVSCVLVYHMRIMSVYILLCFCKLVFGIETFVVSYYYSGNYCYLSAIKAKE